MDRQVDARDGIFLVKFFMTSTIFVVFQKSTRG